MAEVNDAVSKLKTGYDPNGRIQITAVDSPIHNLLQYIKCADPENVADIHKLNNLADRIDKMDSRECELFAGALDAESINGLDDVLRLAEHLDDYILLPGITSDIELGGKVQGGASGRLRGILGSTVRWVASRRYDHSVRHDP